MKNIDGRKASKDVQQERRILAVKAVTEGKMRQAEAARFFEISESAISKWIKKYKHGGVPRLIGDKRGSKKPQTILSAHQANAIQKLIQTRIPNELNLPFLLWSLDALQMLISQRYKKVIAKRTLSTLLDKWGFTIQKPAKKVMEQKPELVQKWLEEDYPRIQQRAKKENAEINWLDESGIQSADNRGRSYAKKGKTSSIKINAKKNRANFILTVNKLGTMRFMTYLGKMDSQRLIEFLGRLTRSGNRKKFVILDNLSVHKSKEVKEWVKEHEERIELFYLSNYSPDLNSDEYLNRP
jgi:transposase